MHQSEALFGNLNLMWSHKPLPSDQERLRQIANYAGSTLPVIFITALEDTDLHAQAERAGCVASFRQPFEAAPSIAAISTALER